MPDQPRKKRRSINESGHAHFVTFSCWKRWPLLSRDRSRQWMIDTLENVRRNLDVAILAYVIMPEHVHLLLLPRQRSYEMRRILAALKAPVARKARAFLEESGQNEWLSRLMASHGQRQVFRFWQPGGGYDQNLWSSRPIIEVIDYIHANPVRRGLAERPTDWYWSSAATHAGVNSVPLRMDPVLID